MTNAIIEVLMKRDGLTFEEATKQFQTAREEFEAGVYGTDIEECLAQEFGLELDYVFDFLEII